MRRDLLIGIFVSILAHVGVAWLGGLGGHHAPPPPVREKPPLIQIVIPPVQPDEPPPQDAGAQNNAPADIAPPMQPDVPTMAQPDSFVQTLEPPPPDAPHANLGQITIPKGNIHGLQGMVVFNLKDLDQAPMVRTPVQPIYPEEMTKEGEEGTVIINFIVDANGNTTEVHAASSTRQEFEQPAIDAILKWKFRPGRKGGKAVATRMTIPMKFTLNNSDN